LRREILSAKNAFAVISPTLDGQADLSKILVEKFTARPG